MTLEDEIYLINELLLGCFSKLELNNVSLDAKSIMLNRFLIDINETNHLRDVFKRGAIKRSPIEKFISDLETYRKGYDDSSVKLGYRQCKEVLENEKSRLENLNKT